MKVKALIGFTYIDAMIWLADECRARGVAMAISAKGKRAWLGDEWFLIEPDEASARDAARIMNAELSEIITREIVA